MKYAIPLGAILLIGIASSLSRSPASPATTEKLRPVRQGPVPETIRTETARPDAVEAAPMKAPERNLPMAGPLPAAGAGWKKMLGTLDRSVGLSSVQQPALEQLLRDREDEIRAYQQSIRSTGIVDVRDYEWRIDLMKDSWYRRMDALLDGPQHDRFLALLEKGFLNEGLEFTIEPGMTVLD